MLHGFDRESRRNEGDTRNRNMYRTNETSGSGILTNENKIRKKEGEANITNYELISSSYDDDNYDDENQLRD